MHIPPLSFSSDRTGIELRGSVGLSAAPYCDGSPYPLKTNFHQCLWGEDRDLWLNSSAPITSQTGPSRPHSAPEAPNYAVREPPVGRDTAHPRELGFRMPLAGRGDFFPAVPSKDQFRTKEITSSDITSLVLAGGFLGR